MIPFDQARQQYADEGYFILDQAMRQEALDLILKEYEALVEEIHRKMDSRGTDAIGVNRRNRQYLITDCHTRRPALGAILFSDLMADICRASIGDDAYLLWDQFVVKGPGMSMPFSWHQDGGCIGHDHRPYVICWIALDRMDTDNGTLHILPFLKAGVRDRVVHHRDPSTGQPVGYFGSETGAPVVGLPGTIGVYSSLSFHSSGPNTSDRFRRSYLVQYTPEPMKHADGVRLFGRAAPFLKNGEKVTP